jgi:hypothetical protein
MDSMCLRRSLRWCAGAVLGVLLLMADRFQDSGAQAGVQMIVCVLAYGFLCLEMSHTLNRRIPQLIMASLFPVHLAAIYLVRKHFPFNSGLTVIFGLFAELTVMVFLYLRLCQDLDPSGPFGMKASDRQRTPKLPKLF